MSTEKSSMTNIEFSVAVPKKYKVIILDSYKVPREFVEAVLQSIFFKSSREAELIIRIAEKTNEANVGVYTYDMANTKVCTAKNMAAGFNFPLEFRIEEE